MVCTGIILKTQQLSERTLRPILEPGIHTCPYPFPYARISAEINGGNPVPNRTCLIFSRIEADVRHPFPASLQLRDVWLRLCSSTQPIRIDALEWVSCATLDIMGIAGESSVIPCRRIGHQPMFGFPISQDSVTISTR